jgi:hypothetical protein
MHQRIRQRTQRHKGTLRRPSRSVPPSSGIGVDDLCHDESTGSPSRSGSTSGARRPWFQRCFESGARRPWFQRCFENVLQSVQGIGRRGRLSRAVRHPGRGGAVAQIPRPSGLLREQAPRGKVGRWIDRHSCGPQSPAVQTKEPPRRASAPRTRSAQPHSGSCRGLLAVRERSSAPWRARRPAPRPRRGVRKVSQARRLGGGVGTDKHQDLGAQVGADLGPDRV